MNKLIAILIVVFSCSSLAAQVCRDEAISPGVDTSTDDRFEVDEANGVVLDKFTGLMWQQCEVGLIYNADAKACTGSPQKLTWQQALLAANTDYATFVDWHVPNIKELASIIEHHCANPALNAEVFLFSDELLNAEELNYWSSTSVYSTPTHAWTFQVSDGKNRQLIKTASGRVRLVRYAK